MRTRRRGGEWRTRSAGASVGVDRGCRSSGTEAGYLGRLDFWLAGRRGRRGVGVSRDGECAENEKQEGSKAGRTWGLLRALERRRPSLCLARQASRSVVSMPARAAQGKPKNLPDFHPSCEKSSPRPLSATAGCRRLRRWRWQWRWRAPIRIGRARVREEAYPSAGTSSRRGLRTQPKSAVRTRRASWGRMYAG